MNTPRVCSTARRIALVVLGFALLSPAAIGLDLIVDPQAPPNEKLAVGQPFNEVATALDALALYRAAHPELEEPIRVVLAAGDYQVLESIELNVAHSGTPESPTVLVAPESGRSRLTGGVQFLDSFSRAVDDPSILNRLPPDNAGHLLRIVDLTEVMEDEALALISDPVHRGMGVPVRPVGSEVFFNGEALIRARWPNSGFAQVSKVIDPGSVPRNRADDISPEKRETGALRGGVFEFDDAERLQRWVNSANAWASGYWHWDWADEQLPIESIDADTKQIKLGLPHRYGLRDNAEFYITNLLEEIDAPGEYYIDGETKRLFYYAPRDARAINTIAVSISDAPLVRVVGGSHIRFENIRFETTRGPALVAHDCTNLTIQNCTFRNIGTDGIVISGTNNRIIDNELSAIGASAINASGGDRATLAAAKNEILRNHIHDFGRIYRTYQPAVRLGGVGQHVANNRIHNAPHSAIMFSGNDHIIERNEIFNVLLETGDCGAIYCGRDWTLHGNIIRNNFFHHLEGTEGRYQNAVYLDDMASGIQVIGNIFFNCHWGMLVGGGRDNIIQGNVFIGGTKAISFDARGVGWMAPNIDDPSTSTLHKNLAAVPYKQPPWSTRFPQLQNYLTDRFGRPVGSEFVGNAIYNTSLGRIDDRECVRVEDNPIAQLTSDAIFINPSADPRNLKFARDVWSEPQIPGFEPIPLGSIGLIR